MVASDLDRLLNAVMERRVVIDPTKTPRPNVYQFMWGTKLIEIDLAEHSVSLDSQAYNKQNDPTANQAVISIIGFVKGQLGND